MLVWNWQMTLPDRAGFVLECRDGVVQRIEVREIAESCGTFSVYISSLAQNLLEQV